MAVCGNHHVVVNDAVDFGKTIGVYFLDSNNMLNVLARGVGKKGKSSFGEVDKKERVMGVEVGGAGEGM